MSSSDDFKEAIKAGRLKEALVLAMGKAIELNITTWVSQKGDRVAAVDRSTTAKPGYRLQTRINLMAGDIENEIGDRFIGNGPYHELREFHQQQVADGNKILQHNIQSLQKLFGILNAIQQQGQVLPTAKQPLELAETDSYLLPTSPTTPPSLTPAETPSSEREWEDLGVVSPSPSSDSKDAAGWEGVVVEDEENLPSDSSAVIPPSPDLPVSELEIEDWEDLTEETELLSLEDLGTEGDLVEDAATLERAEDAIFVSEREAIAPEPPATPSASAEDWGDFAEVPAPELATPSPLAEDEDWEGLETASPPESPALDTVDLEEDWGDFAEVPAPELATPSPLAEDEDWGDLETEIQPPSLEEDWGDFAEVPAPELATPSPLAEDEDWEGLETASPLESPALDTVDLEEDWGDFAEVPAPELETPSPLAEDEDWENLTEVSNPESELADDTDLSNIDLTAEEDWDNFEEGEPAPEAGIPDLGSLNLDREENWDSDWIEEDVVFPAAAPQTDSVDFGTEEDWEDFEALDPFANNALENSTVEEDSEENWDDFAADELEPYPKLSEDDLSPSASTGAIPMPPPTDPLSEDWEETAFGSEVASDSSDLDLFEGLTSADARRPAVEENHEE